MKLSLSQGSVNNVKQTFALKGDILFLRTKSTIYLTEYRRKIWT